MKLTVTPDVFARYPTLCIAVLVMRGVDNTQNAPEVETLREQEVAVAQEVFRAQPISSHPVIRAWRDAYQVFGTASRYHSSIEALVTRVAKGGTLPTINTMVDLYNIVSIKYVLPIGGEDLKTIRGDIRLCLAEGTEEFLALGTTQNDPPPAGEIIYRDDEGCLCRRINWREADRTKLTRATEHAIFYCEGIPPTNDIDVKEAADQLARWIRHSCGGTPIFFLLGATHPIITIPFP
jgi:DNA/RNA-binding domain of Phe-tRNA-synthetase-like protein